MFAPHLDKINPKNFPTLKTKYPQLGDMLYRTFRKRVLLSMKTGRIDSAISEQKLDLGDPQTWPQSTPAA